VELMGCWTMEKLRGVDCVRGAYGGCVWPWLVAIESGS